MERKFVKFAFVIRHSRWFAKEWFCYEIKDRESQ